MRNIYWLSLANNTQNTAFHFHLYGTKSVKILIQFLKFSSFLISKENIIRIPYDVSYVNPKKYGLYISLELWKHIHSIWLSDSENRWIHVGNICKIHINIFMYLWLFLDVNFFSTRIHIWFYNKYNTFFCSHHALLSLGKKKLPQIFSKDTIHLRWLERFWEFKDSTWNDMVYKLNIDKEF